MNTDDTAEKEKKKYWYHTTTFECVLCGRRNVYKIRRYDEKPDAVGKRYQFAQDACDDHFF